ncbi:MAG: hypothetical protein KC503_10015 [Myxococcales bacterium]|nr:hypothetical protein [Myxococcales bacterium]
MGVNFTPDHGCTRWKWTSLDPNVVTVGLPVCTLEGDSYVARVEVSALAEGMVKIVGSVDDQSRDCTFNIKLGAGDTSVDTTADSSADGVTDAEDGGADSADSAPEATVSDASVDTSYDFVLRDIATCSTIRNPVAASVSTLLPMATTCGSPSDLLAEDGKVVGLARTPQDAPVTVAGVAVTACMQLDFGQAYNVQRIHVVARGVASACGDSCTTGFCGSGHTTNLFVSADGASWAHAGSVAIPPSVLGKVALDNVTASARYLLVCRGGWGNGRDNIEVDHVEICAP